MPVEHSAGAIIFRRDDNKIFYLLLKYSSTTRSIEKEYWGLTKGRIEKGEDEIDTVRREVEEETGLRDIEFVEGFKEQTKYFFKFQGQTIFKTADFYLAETKTKEIKISFEHVGFEWLLFDDAIKRLTYENNRKILEKANSLLTSK